DPISYLARLSFAKFIFQDDPLRQMTNPEFPPESQSLSPIITGSLELAPALIHISIVNLSIPASAVPAIGIRPNVRSPVVALFIVKKLSAFSLAGIAVATSSLLSSSAPEKINGTFISSGVLLVDRPVSVPPWVDTTNTAQLSFAYVERSLTTSCNCAM